MWGQGETIGIFAPSLAPGGVHQRVWGAIERTCASPAMARALVHAWRDTDLSEVMPAVSVPTTVIHRRGDTFPVAAAHHLAERIPGAKLVELEGRDHLPWIGDMEAVVGEIEEALTGERHGRDPTSALTTVVFTDIVDSTPRAAALGDVAWRKLLERHERAVRAEVVAAGGRVVDSTGDGFLIAFDGVVGAIDCGHAVIASARELELEIRVGIHCGECQLMGDNLAGVTVHIGARVCAQASGGEVVVTKVVADLAAGAGFAISQRGRVELKGVPGRWGLLSVAERGQAGRHPPAGPWLAPRDRAFVALARHLPSSLRVGGRLTRRRRKPE